MNCGDFALHPCQRAFQDRNPGFARNVIGGRAIGPACCKVLTDTLLVLREDIDGKFTVLGKSIEATETIVQTDQDEDRVQRDRGKGVDREPIGTAILGLGSDDGNAGGEVPYYFPEIRGEKLSFDKPPEWVFSLQ